VAAPEGAPAKKGCGTGLVVALVVLGVLAVGGLVAVALAVSWVGDKVEDSLIGGSCPFLSEDEAKALFGSDATVQSLDSFVGGLVGVALDTRVLADSDACVVYAGNASPTVRIARAGGGARRYDTERQLAEPQTEDRGGGLSVTREGYVLRDLGTVGDEAFCTTLLPTGASGVLVREGDELVYVSVQGTTLDADATCAEAQRVALAVLD
jgi:hypothetical protein